VYRERNPPARLSPWVECAWSIETDAPVREHRVPPDGCLDVIYSRETGLVAVGAMTVEQRVSLPAAALTAGVRFHPGMAGQFLRAAPGELTDATVPLEALWGARARVLEERLAAAPGADAAASELLEAMPSPASPGNVQRAIAAMTAVRGMADLEWIARQANLSERQFRRRCLEESGLTPKLLCRVLRFRAACRIARGQEPIDWADVAADAGYFDQAHLIHDFREFTGRTPMAVFSNTGGPARG